MLVVNVIRYVIIYLEVAISYGGTYMKILIFSDNIKNNIYSSLETGSVLLYDDFSLSSTDYSIIKNHFDECCVLNVVTENGKVKKVVVGRLKMLNKLSNGKYKMHYSLIDEISETSQILMFSKIYPYSFKQELDVKISNSKELIRLIQFFIKYENNKTMRNSVYDSKRDIINSDFYLLQSYKAVIFTQTENVLVQSKLSHISRVLEIAIRIADEINKITGTKIVDKELLNAIILGMYLGATPFGHVGERAINNILRGKTYIIPNAKLLNLKYFKYNLQSARILERIESINLYENALVNEDVIAGILAHTKLDFDAANIDDDYISSYLNEYFLNDLKIVGEKLRVQNGEIITKNIAGQITKYADRIAQRCYEVELAIRFGKVNIEELVTRLKLLSDIIPVKSDYTFYSQLDTYRNAKKIRQFFEDQLTSSVVKSFKFNVKSENEIKKLVSIDSTGYVILELIEDYFKSKLLISKDIRRFDHKADKIIYKLFEALYNDVHLLPSFYQEVIISEFKRENIKDVNIVFCFQTFIEGKKYLNSILFSDLDDIYDDKIRNEAIRKREIIIQVIIDYIVSLSDVDAIELAEKIG